MSASGKGGTKPKARDLSEVITAILGVVPESESAFRARLKRIEQDAGYLAPEVMGRAWADVAKLFAVRFGGTPPTDGWGAKAVAILRGES